jgi:hypothetical protein
MAHLIPVTFLFCGPGEQYATSHGRPMAISAVSKYKPIGLSFFFVYLTMFSIVKIVLVERQMMRCLGNDELERLETVMASFKILSRCLPG